MKIAGIIVEQRIYAVVADCEKWSDAGTALKIAHAKGDGMQKLSESFEVIATSELVIHTND